MITNKLQIHSKPVQIQQTVVPNNGMDLFINFINVLEGYKTRIKNLHWAADAMNIHLRLDELLGIVSDYEDSIAEESMGMFYKMGPLDIKGYECQDANPTSMLQSLKNRTAMFYNNLSEDSKFAGLKSETEVFIHDLNKYTYLFSLCKG